MSRRRTSRTAHRSSRFVWLLLIADVAAGSVLWRDHGAGPVVVGLITAVLFAVFLRTRPKRRQH